MKVAAQNISSYLCWGDLIPKYTSIPLIPNYPQDEAWYDSP